MLSRYDVHEKEVGELALEMGFEQVSLSSTLMPMVRVVPRGYTGKDNDCTTQWAQVLPGTG